MNIDASHTGLLQLSRSRFGFAKLLPATKIGLNTRTLNKIQRS